MITFFLALLIALGTTVALIQTMSRSRAKKTSTLRNCSRAVSEDEEF
jgi:hypothetical protein